MQEAGGRGLFGWTCLQLHQPPYVCFEITPVYFAEGFDVFCLYLCGNLPAVFGQESEAIAVCHQGALLYLEVGPDACRTWSAGGA